MAEPQIDSAPLHPSEERKSLPPRELPPRENAAPLRPDEVFFRLKDILEDAVEPPARGRRFHEREEDPIDRLRFELLQKQIEAKAAEAVPKARAGEGLVLVAVAVALMATSLTIFFSLSSTLSELQASERDLASRIAALGTSLSNLENRLDRREAEDDRRDERLQKLEASLARIEAQLERAPGRR
jgi:hypothetical protein